jgi:hypothetical protein
MILQCNPHLMESEISIMRVITAQSIMLILYTNAERARLVLQSKHRTFSLNSEKNITLAEEL